MEKYTYIRKTITWDSRRYEVRGKTEQEACEKLADLVVSLKRGEFAASGQTTVEQWFQQWMQTYKIPSGITPKSLRLYDEKYNGYIGPAIGQKKLQDVRDLHLQTILNTQAGRSYSHVYKAIESGTKTVKAPKTPAGVRDIPMRQELRDRLLDAQGRPDDLVFPAPAGGVRSANSLQRLWGSFAHALDLHMGAKVQDGVITKHALAPDLTPYCLRHTFCTDLQRAGVPINVAKELMGHANISVTANIYTHRDQKVLHSNMAKLNPNGRKPSTKPRPKEL